MEKLLYCLFVYSNFSNWLVFFMSVKFCDESGLVILSFQELFLIQQKCTHELIYENLRLYNTWVYMTSARIWWATSNPVIIWFFWATPISPHYKQITSTLSVDYQARRDQDKHRLGQFKPFGDSLPYIMWLLMFCLKP